MILSSMFWCNTLLDEGSPSWCMLGPRSPPCCRFNCGLLLCPPHLPAGPGVRFLVFVQGCAMRCLFCSNPDTWAPASGELVSSKDIAAQVRSVAPYLKPGGGGVTCSGGEAMLQPEFTAAIFQEAHALGLTTCLDTTGQGSKHHHWDKVLPHTDMVLFCIKSLNEDRYMELTGVRQKGALKFAAELKVGGAWTAASQCACTESRRLRRQCTAVCACA